MTVGKTVLGDMGWKPVITFELDEGKIEKKPGLSVVGSTQILDIEKPVHENTILTISDKSVPGKQIATHAEAGDVFLGVAIGEPEISDDDGVDKKMRSVAVELHGYLFRDAIVAGNTDIKAGDKCSYTSDGVVKDDDGDYYAIFGLETATDYEYVDLFLPLGNGKVAAAPTP